MLSAKEKTFQRVSQNKLNFNKFITLFIKHMELKNEMTGTQILSSHTFQGKYFVCPNFTVDWCFIANKDKHLNKA